MHRHLILKIIQDEILLYIWEFDDGTTDTGTVVAHAYAAWGNYPVTLKVYGNNKYLGACTTKLVQVAAPPVPSFSSNIGSGTAPVAIDFNATASTDPNGEIIRYSWDFGDGTFASGATVSHTFNKGGSYNVALTVIDNDRLSATAATTIDINAKPNARFTIGTTGSDAPLDATLDASGSSDSDGSIVSYEWMLGDGSTATGETVNHTYTNPGNYKVNLTVTDNNGATHSSFQYVMATNLILNWDGQMVSSSLKLRDGNPQKTIGLDVDGDGDFDDASIDYPFSSNIPLSPLEGYFGVPMYGGIVGNALNTESVDFNDHHITNGSTRDYLNLRFQREGNMHAAILFVKEDFMGGGDSIPVSFDANSSLSISTNHFDYLGDARWLVRESETYAIGDVVNFEAYAGDEDGNVAMVSFFVNGEKIGETSSQPFVSSYTADENGKFAAWAVAIDNEGDSAFSKFSIFNVGTSGAVVPTFPEPIDNEVPMHQDTEDISSIIPNSNPTNEPCQTAYVNQQSGGGVWRSIGTFELVAGNENTVTIKNAGTSGYVIADAVRFLRNDLEIIVDNTEALTTGTWTVSSSSTGFIGSNYLHDGNNGKGDKLAVYTPGIPESGSWEVFVTYTSNANRASNVPVEVCVPEVSGGVAPVVSLDAPADGAEFDQGSFIELVAAASDED
ncbi:MAG: PKD domain-containing protein, partial [Bacteroidales bacterium]|nr:PKD domain-containing protein [Bacteroidales bacterium]